MWKMQFDNREVLVTGFSNNESMEFGRHIKAPLPFSVTIKFESIFASHLYQGKCLYMAV